MGILTKRDMGAIFSLLALVYLFDAVASYFVVLGLVVFIIMVGGVWFSTQPVGMTLLKKQPDGTAEWFPRAGIILTLLGVLILNAWIVAIGFLIAELILFLPNESWTVDFWKLSMSSIKNKKK